MIRNDNGIHFSVDEYLNGLTVSEVLAYETTCLDDSKYYVPTFNGVSNFGSKITITPNKEGILIDVCFGSILVNSMVAEMTYRSNLLNKFSNPCIFLTVGNSRLIIGYNLYVNFYDTENAKMQLTESQDEINQIAAFLSNLDVFEKYYSEEVTV
jgi:hypothetical protein